jgi:hypothetical protein
MDFGWRQVIQTELVLPRASSLEAFFALLRAKLHNEKEPLQCLGSLCLHGIYKAPQPFWQ